MRLVLALSIKRAIKLGSGTGGTLVTPTLLGAMAVTNDLNQLFVNASSGKLEEDRMAADAKRRAQEMEPAWAALLALANRLEEVKQTFGSRGYQAQIHGSETDLPGLDLHTRTASRGGSAKCSPILIVHPSPANMSVEAVARARYLELGGPRAPDYHGKWGERTCGIMLDRIVWSEIWVGFDSDSRTYYSNVPAGGDTNYWQEDRLRTVSVDDAAAWVVEQTAKLPKLPLPYVSASSTNATDTTGNAPVPLPKEPTPTSTYVKWILFAGALVAVLWVIVRLLRQ